ncbi:MAG: response regulator transcription factor [Gammaproteobacteria bacterium]
MNETARARVILADDHQMVAEGLRGLLEPHFDLVSIVNNGHDLLAAVDKYKPDAVVADISMPLLNGIDAAARISDKHPDISIVLLTMYPDASYVRRAFDAGVSAYVLKHSAPSELVTAINEALKGHVFVTPGVAGEDLSQHRDSDGPDLSELTQRQREVIQLLAEGRSAKEVASILDISARTVEFHKYRIMRLLGIQNTAELVQFAIRHGLISD